MEPQLKWGKMIYQIILYQNIINLQRKNQKSYKNRKNQDNVKNDQNSLIKIKQFLTYKTLKACLLTIWKSSIKKDNNQSIIK